MKSAFFMILFLPACASFSPDRGSYFAAGGATSGALLGYKFSPNEESQGLNALVFGALGAGLGYLSNRLFSPKEESKAPSDLISRELGVPRAREITLPATDEKLPEFVEKRLTPIVLEEYVEKDSVTEDGALREPHRVWRIKRQPELVPIDK